MGNFMNDDSTKELDYKSIRNKINYNNSSENIINNNLNSNDNIINNTDDNIDEQLQESIKKLVKEQTNVARAEYYENDINDNSLKTTNNELSKREKEYINNIKQEKPKEIEVHGSTDSTDVSDIHRKTREASKTKTQKTATASDTSQSEQKNNNLVSNTNKKNNTSKKNIILLCTFIGLLIIAIYIAIAVNNNGKSYSYNYDKAKQLKQQGKYQEALEYFNKAYNTVEGNNNIELMMSIYECYNEYGAKNDAISTLNKILEIDSSNENALSALLAYYNENEDGEQINNLIENFKNYDTSDIFNEYQPSVPEASIASGKYYESLELELLTEDSDIYYTIDGSTPSVDSIRYNDTIILEKGVTTIKCIAVNDIGVYSDIAEYNYEVEFKQPDVPQIALASGTYAMGQTVEIEDIPEDCTVYYTLDGTYPSTTSQVYSEPIELPEGNIILSAIAVDSHDLVSSVIKRNYIIQPEKKYSFEEAKEILRARMEQTGLIKQNLDITNDGSLFTFVYQSKINIDGIDLYYIRMDVKKDNHTTTRGYYGVGIKNGICYTVDNSDEGYIIQEY